MPSYNTVAFVTRAINFGESDRILTLYSRDIGRFGVIAKGARKPVSRLSGSTEVLNCTKFHLARGKSLDIVTQCEIHDSFVDLRRDLQRMAHALYLVELLDHSVEDRVPHPPLFDLLYSAFHLIERTKQPDLICRWFEIRLFGELGYAPILVECAVCGTALQPYSSALEYGLSASLGGALCEVHSHADRNPDHSGLSGDALQLLAKLVAIDPNDAEILLEMSGTLPHPANQIRIAMRRYHRFRDDRELKSLSFLDSVCHAF